MAISRDIQRLLQQWEKCDAYTLRDAHSCRQQLAQLVNMAIDILLDMEKKDDHAGVRQLMERWFFRTFRLWLAVRDVAPDDYGLQKQCFENIKVFNEPDLGLESWFEKDFKFWEALDSLAKPRESWTAKDKSVWEWLLEHSRS